jgi:hypothetical protein
VNAIPIENEFIGESEIKNGDGIKEFSTSKLVSRKLDPIVLPDSTPINSTAGGI